jgi:hypothetical protein
MGGHEDPWLVRIEDDARGVHGAGTLLDEAYVLTCAHVVEQARGKADGDVWVRVAGRTEDPYRATVEPCCWQPPLPDHRGDVAVLRLDRPVAGAPRARIRRTWQHGERVRVFGFPARTDNGQRVDAVLRSYDFSHERIQLDAVREPRVHQGFSGAAALADSGEILGVIAEVRGPQAESSWMISARTLQAYASSVIDDYLVRRPSRDERFSHPAPEDHQTLDNPVRLALTQQLVAWLGSDGPGGVCAVGGPGAVRVVSRLVGLTVPAYRAAASALAPVTDAPAGTLPPVGGVDAAVDATGKPTAEIAQEVATSLSLPTDTGARLVDQLEELGSPVVVVVNSVDAAADPYDLYQRVLRPVAVRAPEIGVRLLLGYRELGGGDRGSVAYPRAAVAADLAGLHAQRGELPGAAERVRLLDRLVAAALEVATAERDTLTVYQHVAPRISAVPEQRVAAAAALRVRTGLLKEIGGVPEQNAALAEPTVRAWLAGELAACTAVANKALARAQHRHRELTGLLAHRDRLRARLDAYRAEAAAHGLVEDLGDSYEAARGLLYHGLCDLDEAERRVADYHAAVRHQLDGPASGDANARTDADAGDRAHGGARGGVW